MAIQVNVNQFPIIVYESLSGKDIPKSSKSLPGNAEPFLHPLLILRLKSSIPKKNSKIAVTGRSFQGKNGKLD
jgi:hypothetical protein